MSASPQLPGVFHTLAPILNHYGYLAVGGLVLLEDFGVPVPGETILIAAAVYAGAGRLNVVGLAAIAFVAAVVGDNIGFAIGHFGGAGSCCGGVITCSSPPSGCAMPRSSSPATAARSSPWAALSRAFARPTASSPGYPRCPGRNASSLQRAGGGPVGGGVDRRRLHRR